MYRSESVFSKRIISFEKCRNPEYINTVKTTNFIMSSNKYVLFDNGGYVILDFGEEMCARLHLHINSCENNSYARVRLGESVAETCAELGEKNCGNDHSLRDLVYRISPNLDISTSESGFRFARIDFTGNDIKLNGIYAEKKCEKYERKGYFVCSDEEINDIYNVAVDTLSLCVQNGTVWDGIKRDRAVWLGDFHGEMLTAFNVYGNIEENKAVLDTVGEYDDGWVNHIPLYSAWWIICLYDYYRLSGDWEYTQRTLNYIGKILKDFDCIIKDDGNISYDNSKLKIYADNQFFFDWPTNFTNDSKIAWRAVLIMAIRNAIELLDKFEKDSELAKSLISRLKKVELKESEYKQVEAFRFLIGESKAEKTKEVLLKGGSSGLTCFMNYYILKALYESGGKEETLKFIKEYYGGMLKMGATTFWEDFDLQWLKDNPLPIDAMPNKDRKNIHSDYGRFCYQGLRHSLCHGWSSSVATFLTETVLGVTPVTEGYKTVKIKPNLLGLKFAKGKIPTKYGIIEVSHENINGKIKTKIKLPKGVKIVK